MDNLEFNSPFSVLERNLNKEILIILNKRKKTITGTLMGYDKQMNITLADARVYEDEITIIKQLIVRGRNILAINPFEDILISK